MTTNKRPLPQDIEAEKSVIGSCIIETEVIPEVVSLVSPADFYLLSHGTIFGAIQELWNQQRPVDLITVSDFLKARGYDISSANIASMASEVLPSHAPHHARLVKNAAQRRNLLETMREASEQLYAGTADPVELAGSIGSALRVLDSGDGNGFRHASQVVAETIRNIEQAYEAGNLVTGIPTGLKDIDMRLGGLHRGESVVIGGRTSMGKTALGAAFATGAARNGFGSAIVSLESPNPKLMNRMLSETTGIENRDLRRGRIDEAQLRKLIEAAARIGDLPLWFLDSDRSWEKIKARIQAMKLREPGLALVILDYVGLIHAPVARGERYLEIGKISSDSKQLAMELNICVVLLSQLNRGVEQREGKRPNLADLRESGSLEQDADVVGLLYREHYYNESSIPKNLAELNVAKNRDGATGVIKLKFEPETVSFSDWVEPVGRNFYESAEQA